MTTSDYSVQERLMLLYRLSQAFNSSLDLDEVLNRVMDEVISVMRAERGFLMLRDQNGTLSFQVARGIDQQTLDHPELQVSRGMVQGVADGGLPVLTGDAQIDRRFMSRQSVLLQGLRSVMCVPLKLKDRVTGVIYVDNRFQAGVFNGQDLELLNAIASSAAIAIENARLYQVAVEKGRMERELQMAYQVQVGLMPQEMPQSAGWNFAARWQPARQVAGDYYDIFQIDGDELGIVIADVADKGMPAALFMASTRSIVRASLRRGVALDEAITRANQLISQESTRGMFVTVFCMLLDQATGRLTYVNAGHNPPLLFDVEKDQLVSLQRTGMALGVDENANFESKTAILAPGGFTLLYTDGVTDARDAQGRDYGLERLVEVINALRRAPCEQVLSTLERSVSSFIGDTPLYDDMTIVLTKRL